MISRRKRSISSAAMLAEVVVQGFAGFELLAVDQERVAAGRSGLPCSSKLRNRSRRPFSSVVDAVFVLALEAGDVVVDQLGGGRCCCRRR